MGRKSRRSVYDPSIIDRLASDADSSTAASNEVDPLALSESQPYHDDPNFSVARPYSDDPYSAHFEPEHQAHQEILDPKLHGLNKKNTRGRRRCLIALVCAGVLAIIVTVAVIASRGNGGGSGSSKSKRATLPPITIDLMQTCKDGRTDTNAHQTCREWCEKAQCCEYSTNFDLSCLKGNENLCMDYAAACYILPDTWDYADDDDYQVPQEIPEAPHDLKQFCKVNKLTGDAASVLCGNFCEPYRCCYDTAVPSCQHNSNCKGYSPCLHHKASKKVDEDVVDEIEEACVEVDLLQQDERDRCANKCKNAACCFLGDGDCREKNRNFCTMYEPCAVIFNEDLGEAADDDALDDDRYDGDYNSADDDVVDVGDFLDKDDLDDADDDNADDDDYVNPVDQFNGEQTILPPLPPDIQEVCSEEYVDDDDSFDECKGICDRADCCNLPERQPQSCLHGNHLLCLEYKRNCAAVNGVTIDNSSIPPPDPDLDDDDAFYDICSAQSLATPHGLEACVNHCEPARCCWADGADSCMNNEECDDYAPCFSLNANEADDDYVQNTIESNLNQYCTVDQIGTAEGRAACESVCLQHTCCRDGTCGANANMGNSCSMFSGCTILDTQKHPSADVLAPPPTTLSTVCDEAKAGDSTAMAQCKQECAAANCCSVSGNLPGSCVNDHHQECQMWHKECAVLKHGGAAQNTNEASVPQASNQLEMLCSQNSLSTNHGRKKCRDECAKGNCCWNLDLNPGEQSCHDLAVCASYSACQRLAAADNTNAENAPTNAVTSAVEGNCDLKLLRHHQGLEMCRTVCYQHQCCWDGSSTCDYDSNVCRDYMGCKVLLKGESNP